MKLRPKKIWRINGSHVIALPPEWLHANKLLPGLFLQASLDKAGRLVLDPAQEETKNEA